MPKDIMNRPVLLAIGVALIWGMPAQAQEDSAPAASAGDSNDIIVTARRREESLQDTPIAITAVSATMLENKASVNIGDLQGAAPGLLITQQNSGAQAANISIRGLTYADIEKSQTPTVGVVVDGITIGSIAEGETLHSEIDPQKHRVEARLDAALHDTASDDVGSHRAGLRAGRLRARSI